ncbi:MAG TPA: chromate transporter, partial [Pseudonocardiaceae bacterium]|nr:chromate transporter [Pseudonocardiaceae bacterium]
TGDIMTEIVAAAAVVHAPQLLSRPPHEDLAKLDRSTAALRQFGDVVAMGLITPGPVVITAGFIGYLVAGLPGAVIATVAIFVPIYLGVIVPGRWFLRHRDNTQVKAFVSGATSAAAGALAGAVVVLTRQAVIDRPTAAIAVVTLGLLWRFKIGEPYIVVAAGALGILLH